MRLLIEVLVLYCDENSVFFPFAQIFSSQLKRNIKFDKILTSTEL